MEQREKELIAMLVGDAPRSPETTHWLTTDEGQRELAAYRDTLRALQRAYGKVSATQPDAAVHYTTIDAPIGRVFIAATQAGLVRISFRRSEASFVSELHDRLRTGIVKSPGKLANAVAQLDAYFAGKRRSFDLPVDWRIVTPFQRRVLEATRAVPAGQVASYGDIAWRIRQPKASRAVGQALGRNPIPIVIPCTASSPAAAAWAATPAA